MGPREGVDRARDRGTVWASRQRSRAVRGRTGVGSGRGADAAAADDRGAGAVETVRGNVHGGVGGAGTRRRWRKGFLARAGAGRGATREATTRAPSERVVAAKLIARRGERKTNTRQEEAVKRLASGTCATVVVRTILAPLERVKIEYLLNGSKLKPEELVRAIMRKEGALGLWKGNVLNIARTAPFKAINFCAFDTYREFVIRSFPPGSDGRRIGLLCAGAGAGMTAVVTCFPMDVIRTRLLTTGGKEKYGSFLACVRTMYRQEGTSTFYRGITPALVSMVPNAAVYYSIYDGLKNRRLAQLNAELAEQKKRQKGGKRDDDTEVRTIEQKNMMLYGAIAGIASEATTYPFEVVRRRMQMQSGRSTTDLVIGRKALMSVVTSFRTVASATGWKSLYAGLGPSCIQVLPSAALGYYTYEMFKLLFDVD
ncbi:Mitochondrial substrate/solute carrier [Ostreococcus tauri]|uniref:Mitochondrial substrate/solute carrier n=1 Tax=Ostreococcus tauri TaxID=70448 RepID=Q01BW9_OSTTA|nr:Mitochondrial substrate/solute carrier [Ostreococcus tauri]CAL53189.1 Mitochondrial substrate/solute carrier [Ostreococcus tauri]|eukprot:XP_003078448.1 Mitochondrial substrate/solute carrier [Ostreococcus tauri]